MNDEPKVHHHHQGLKVHAPIARISLWRAPWPPLGIKGAPYEGGLRSAASQQSVDVCRLRKLNMLSISNLATTIAKAELRVPIG